MLLDEPPSILIAECTSNFHTLSDRDALLRISDTLSTLRSSRSVRLSTHTQSLKKNNRKFQSMQTQHRVAVEAHDPSGHAEKILRLDGEKFRVAKECSDAEIEGERLEGEARRAETLLKELEQKSGSNVKGGNASGRLAEVEGGQDREVLKLKLYRSLGVDVEAEADGQVRRAVVRDAREGTCRVVDFDPLVARGVYAEKFWRGA